MKNYTITVNGTAYDVTVEENENGARSSSRSSQRQLPQSSSQAAAPAPKAAPSISRCRQVSE